jgi:hypothetical protein
MIRAIPIPISAVLRGAVFAVGGVACFAVVVAAALYALGMTLVLVLARPIATITGRVRADAEPQLEAAPAP